MLIPVLSSLSLRITRSFDVRDRYTHTHLFYYLSKGFRMAYFQMPIIYSEKTSFRCTLIQFSWETAIWEMQYFLHLGFLTPMHITKVAPGNSLVVQWLELRALTAGARIHSLIGDLRCCKLSGVAKKKKVPAEWLTSPHHCAYFQKQCVSLS